MSCDRRLLSAYRDGELSPEQKRAVDEHLRLCGECTAALRGYVRLAQTIRALPIRPVPSSLRADLRRRIAERERARGARDPLGGLIRAMTPAAAAAGAALAVLIVFRPGAIDGPLRVPAAQAPAVSEAPAAAHAPAVQAPAAPPVDQPRAAPPAPPASQPPRVVAQVPATTPSGAGVPAAGLVVQPDGGQRLAGLPSAIGRLYRGNERVRERLGQPAQGNKTVAIVEQSFQGGMILWRSDTREIYVLQRKEGTWAAYPSTWGPGDPVAVDETPPPGAMAPEGSFGHLWSTEPEVRARLGWAVYEPRGSGGAIQEFERGLVIWSPHGLLYVLGEDGRWKSFADATPL